MTVQAVAAFDPRQFFSLRQPLDAPVSRLDTKVAGVAAPMISPADSA